MGKAAIIPKARQSMKAENRRWHILTAVALGLILGFYIEDSVSSQHQSMAPPVVPVVVAAANISPGTVLRAETLRVVQWPERILPPNTINSIQKIQGLVITVPVNQGEPILLPKLVQRTLKEIT
jgi:Flp pilus assembly protein CpaB